MNNREIKENNRSNNPKQSGFCFRFCWNKSYKSSIDSTRVADAQFQQEINKQDYLVKPLEGENGVLEAELMIMGPPRFLFTINEETKEDLLESEDRKSKSLNDFLTTNSNATISPYLTPIPSPPFLTPVSNHKSQSNGGYHPMYEASSDAEFNRMVKLSPPPKFKFLRDAEEKLQRKLMFIEEAKLERDLHKVREDENGSFISIVVDDNNKGKEDNKDDKLNHHYYHFSNSQSGDSSSTSTSCCSSSTLASSSNKKFKSFLIM
ncbi:uncharacterized protein LOC110706104 isoform X2 [Chenopodium quinoa]|nr:uncharacterized protein LOC110706104 isoform X2 [Chenopodium quinoa]